ncbi:sensor histidine kinase [Dawidia soli]|uniref:Histidine kinase n=1 Tax=Dawidia soli TaxID=2782352 RepID=A0AAP2GBS5_9BACT|nr:histidine kinase [Dawidia soli]MBT1685489.1 histidine kinase [Dawidia soli]
MERFWKYKIDHVIFWIGTVVFHMFTRVHLIAKAGFAQFLLEVLIRNALLGLAIFVNIFVLIPRFAQQKKWALYILFLLLDLVFYVIAKNAHDVYLYGYAMGDHGHVNFFHNTFYNLSIALFYMTFSVALQLSREWYAQRELIRKIEVEKLNTELDYLKAQINPHFLFNSINTIYFQIDKHNTLARETLSSFSEMLRYQLYECNGKEIPIEKEVAYLRNYVDLQRHRNDENYQITFQDHNLGGFTIAPLLLIPFIENAFKHVSHRPEGNRIDVDLSRQGDTFHMNIFNTKEARHPARGEPSGIGLKNVQRRLELLYKDRHALSIQESPDHFEVKLTLKIN